MPVMNGTNLTPVKDIASNKIVHLKHYKCTNVHLKHYKCTFKALQMYKCSLKHYKCTNVHLKHNKNSTQRILAHKHILPSNGTDISF